METEAAIKLVALNVDGVLTDGRMIYGLDGSEQKVLSCKDMEAIAEAGRLGFQVALVTGEDTPWVEGISRRLPVDHVVRGAEDKLEGVKQLAASLHIPLSAVCYIGDSLRDVPVISAAGVGMAPADAMPQAKAAADILLRTKGGEGVVAEALSYLTTQSKGAKQREQDEDADLQVYRAQQYLEEAVGVLQETSRQLAPTIVRAAELIAAAFMNHRRLLIFSDPASVVAGQLLMAELTGCGKRRRESKAVLIRGKNAAGIRVQGRAGDVALAITVDGSSAPMIEALGAAMGKRMQTIALTGKGGEGLAGQVDLLLAVPSAKSSAVREAQILIIQALGDLVRSNLTLQN